MGKSQMYITCVQPGAAAFLIDHGRPGQSALAIPTSGAADRRAAKRLRDILALPPEAVMIECSLRGGQWLLSGQGQIAIGGADMPWKLNGRPLEAYTTIDIAGDYLLDGGTASCGCRSYIAIRGEWKVPKIMGSVSPGLPGIGPITKGWQATIDTWPVLDYFSDFDPYQHCPKFPLHFPVSPGPEWSLLQAEEQALLLEKAFRVSPESNRQGLRLQLAAPNEAQNKWPQRSELRQMISSPVLPGTIQLTPDGLLLLLCDAQTVGGFPRVLLLSEAEATDLAAQLKAGDELHFSLSGLTRSA